MYIPTWLIILVVIFYLVRFKLKRRASTNPFGPYYIHVSPNWLLLLKDHGLVTEETWETIRSNMTFNSDYNALRDGISFTVLKVEPESDLIFWDNHKTFHTEVKFVTCLDEIKFVKNGFAHSAEFYVKWRDGGYEIGITTPESSEKTYLAGDDMDHVKVATIPISLFSPMYPYGDKRNDVLRKHNVQRLKELGWEWKELSGEESVAGFPEELVHKYFNVTFKYI